MTRETIVNAINDLPREFDLEQLFQKLVFIEKVEAARLETEEDEIITHAQMKGLISDWHK